MTNQSISFCVRECGVSIWHRIHKSPILCIFLLELPRNWTLSRGCRRLPISFIPGGSDKATGKGWAWCIQLRLQTCSPGHSGQSMNNTSFGCLNSTWHCAWLTESTASHTWCMNIRVILWSSSELVVGAGDVYVASCSEYQEAMVEILTAHGLSLDSITTTPTLGQMIVRPKSSLDRGHDSLSCKTSKGKSHSKAYPSTLLDMRLPMRVSPAKT